MKKVFAVLIAVALVLSLSVTAFADGPSQSGNAGPGQQQTGGFQQGQMPGGAPQMNGQAPDGNSQPPQMNGQAPGMGGPRGRGEAPSDLPEAPEMNGQMPGMDGRGHGMGPQAPGFVDFDAMVTQGVITQDTCDRIKAYMEANKPADLPGGDAQVPGQDGDKPADPPADGAVSEEGGLLKDLLDAGVITQEEYDAINAAGKTTTET